MNESTTLGTWLNQSRLQQRLDLSSLAILSGVDRSTIHRIEKGPTQPTVCTAVRLCNALRVSPEELVFALQGRQISPSPKIIEDYAVLTPKDIASFVAILRRSPTSANEVLAEWLDSLSSQYSESAGHNETMLGSALSSKPLHFSKQFIALLLSDVDFVKSEMQFPPLSDGQYVVDLYERGAAITLRDVGIYIRWVRQQQRKSLAKMMEPVGVSDSALSRIETGALEQIRLMDVLGLDQELGADGKIIRMCWAACDLFPTVARHSANRKFDSNSAVTWNEHEYRLATTLLAIVRWWSYLRPGDLTLILRIHDWLKQFA